MKTIKSLVWFALLFAGLAFAVPGSARGEITFQFFYDSLEPYGEWIEVDTYGYVWRPINISEDWAPYTDGCWVYTDAGWTWDSYEEFGAIVYHYGRWTFLEGEGWIWVPAYDWAPAWVSWRNSPDFIGWAPLPPEVPWSPDVGVGIAVDADYEIGPGWFNFVAVADFGEPVLGPVIINRQRNVTIINQTTNITNITFNNVNNVIFNGGPDITVINRVVRRPINQFNLVQNININNNITINNFRNVRRGNNLIVYAPKVVRKDGSPKRVTHKINKPRVNKGWHVVKNDAERKKCLDHIKKDAGKAADAGRRARKIDGHQVRQQIEQAHKAQGRKHLEGVEGGRQEREGGLRKAGEVGRERRRDHTLPGGGVQRRHEGMQQGGRIERKGQGQPGEPTQQQQLHRQQQQQQQLHRQQQQQQQLHRQRQQQQQLHRQQQQQQQLHRQQQQQQQLHRQQQQQLRRQQQHHQQAAGGGGGGGRKRAAQSEEDEEQKKRRRR